jgi:hypothetical protein
VSPEPVAEPIVGFRQWGTRRGGLFSGIFVAGRFIPNPALSLVAPRAMPSPWPTTGDRVAKCFAVRGHAAPYRDCRCGYAAYYMLPEEPDLPAAQAVWGAVVAWGRVVECERGFRAEYARPVALLDCENPFDRRERKRAAVAAEHYNVPLLPRDELIAYASWHGQLCS